MLLCRITVIHEVVSNAIIFLKRSHALVCIKVFFNFIERKHQITASKLKFQRSHIFINHPPPVRMMVLLPLPHQCHQNEQLSVTTVQVTVNITFKK